MYCCAADAGWITGHTYIVYGPLCNGATTVMFESLPTYPNPYRYWDVVQRLKVTQFYTAPTASKSITYCIAIYYNNHYIYYTYYMHYMYLIQSLSILYSYLL